MKQYSTTFNREHPLLGFYLQILKYSKNDK